MVVESGFGGVEMGAESGFGQILWTYPENIGAYCGHTKDIGTDIEGT